MSTDPFAAPSSASGIDWADLKGALLLVKVNGFEPEVKTTHGVVSAVRADVIVLDDKGAVEAETTYGDTLIFPKVVQSQVKNSQMVLGRLGQGEKKPGQSPPWMLAEATEADKVIARAYVAKTTEAPF